MNNGFAQLVRVDQLAFYVRGADPGWSFAVGESLAATLAASGWAPAPWSDPANRVFARNGWTIDVDRRIAALNARKITDEEWVAGCRVAGIDSIGMYLPPMPAAWIAQPGVWASQLAPAPAAPDRSTQVARWVGGISAFVLFAVVVIGLGGS